MSMWVLISFSLRGLLPLLITVCSYKKLAIFTTNVHTKNECLINYKTVIRSTKPPISCRCCYRLAFLSVVGYNHFYVVRLCHLSSAFLSGLCVGCFIFFLKRWKFFKNNFSFGSALQALFKTLAVWRFVRFLIVLANCIGYFIK
jgi:hypothetical protein